jgi:hypothetical protein
MFVGKGSKALQYERGRATLQIGGRQEEFLIGYWGGNPPSPGGGDTPRVRSLNEIFRNNNALMGELPVALITNFNGATCTCRLRCERLSETAVTWANKMLGRFADAYAERIEAHRQAGREAALDNARRDFQRPDSAYRDIERCELRRSIVDLLLFDQLELLGDTATGSVGVSNGHVSPPSVDTQSLPRFTRFVSFFDRAFDWSNMAYQFSPYFYGPLDDWESDLLVEQGDQQFTAFLTAGAARVQVPVAVGHEAWVDSFFAGLGVLDPTSAIPWLATGRPIALDLAAAASDGFEPAQGSVTVAAKSRDASFLGAVFSSTSDTDRELRIDGKIYRIRSVTSSTSVELDRVVSAAYKGGYERGGVVVGATIPLRLPTTLVAIDTKDVALPTFPGRYA